MTRIVNFRAGDRAELFGVTLMQMFCATTAIPRQEEGGIFDALATLLRRDGPLLFPEDSFLIQFKSRTERKIEYVGQRLRALLDQELALFIGHVDLTTAEISLYSVGAVMTHPNITDVETLVVHIDPVTNEVTEDSLVISLGSPILRWRASHLADQDFADKCYTVMKSWLELDRWNRQCRKLGMQVQVHWKTNELPSRTFRTILWKPAQEPAMLAELIPSIQVLATLAQSEKPLMDPVRCLIRWMREKGADPDPKGLLNLVLSQFSGAERLEQALAKHPNALVAMQLISVVISPQEISFWTQFADREGHSDAKRYHGTPDELRAQGFTIEVDGTSRRVDISDTWFAERGLRVVAVDDEVALLDRVGVPRNESPEI